MYLFIVVLALISTLQTGTSTNDEDISSGGPLCGLYSLYGALSVEGIRIDKDSFFVAEAVSSNEGSSVKDLVDAAQKVGGHAMPVDGLNEYALRAAEHPIIIHVRRLGEHTPYNHWILFLGINGDSARIIDPPSSYEELSLKELLAISDGIGIVISKGDESELYTRIASLFRPLTILSTILACGLFIKSQARLAFPNKIGVISQPICIAAIAFVAFLVDGLIFDSFIMSNRTALSYVVGRHFKPVINEIEYHRMCDLIEDGDAILIDSRFARSYARGTIPNAINLPVYSGIKERNRVIGGFSENKKIIVFCESDMCPYSDAVASDLYHRGFQNVFIYRSGYRDWVKRNAIRAKP